jgi:hypothetical protein
MMMDGKPDARPAPREEQYERVCAEIEAALKLALGDATGSDSPTKANDARVQAFRHLNTALEEVIHTAGADVERARALAMRMIERPEQALRAQIRHSAIGLKSLLND